MPTVLAGSGRNDKSCRSAWRAEQPLVQRPGNGRRRCSSFCGPSSRSRRRGRVSSSALGLVDRLARARNGRFVSIVAPPGYGKTTALAQWAAHDGRPVRLGLARPPRQRSRRPPDVRRRGVERRRDGRPGGVQGADGARPTRCGRPRPSPSRLGAGLSARAARARARRRARAREPRLPGRPGRTASSRAARLAAGALRAYGGSAGAPEAPCGRRAARARAGRARPERRRGARAPRRGGGRRDGGRGRSAERARGGLGRRALSRRALDSTATARHSRRSAATTASSRTT